MDGIETGEHTIVAALEAASEQPWRTVSRWYADLLIGHASTELGDRLLVVDGVVGPPNEGPLVKFLDLMMLVSAGGRERTETEWEALLTAGGFGLAGTTRATANLHVIQAGLIQA